MFLALNREAGAQRCFEQRHANNRILHRHSSRRQQSNFEIEEQRQRRRLKGRQKQLAILTARTIVSATTKLPASPTRLTNRTLSQSRTNFRAQETKSVQLP